MAPNNDNKHIWQAPEVSVTRKKSFDKIKELQGFVTSVDGVIALLPELKKFVDERLAEIKKDVNFGSKIANGGIGDWNSASATLKMATDARKGLAVLNEKAKQDLSGFTKRVMAFVRLSNMQACVDAQKIEYEAERSFEDLKKMFGEVNKQIEWLKRRGFVVEAPTEVVSAPKNKR